MAISPTAPLSANWCAISGGGVERVGVHHHQPGLEAAEHRDRIRQAVGHLQRDAIAVREAGDLAQIHGELVGQPVDLAVGERALRAVGQE